MKQPCQASTLPPTPTPTHRSVGLPPKRMSGMPPLPVVAPWPGSGGGSAAPAALAQSAARSCNPSGLSCELGPDELGLAGLSRLMATEPLSVPSPGPSLPAAAAWITRRRRRYQRNAPATTTATPVRVEGGRMEGRGYRSDTRQHLGHTSLRANGKPPQRCSSPAGRQQHA